MWQYEHSIETDAIPASIWHLYSDVSTWPGWDAGIAEIAIDGPFAAGTTGTMTPAGQTSLAFRIVEAEPELGFADETEIPDAGIVLRFTHRIATLPDGRTRLTHSVAMSGPGAEALGPRMGPGITDGIPQAMATLAQQAAARDGR